METLTMNNIVSIQCGIVIKKIRKENGLSGKELGRKIHISQQQLSRYENGKNKINIDMLFKFSIALNTPFQKILLDILAGLHEYYKNNDSMLIYLLDDVHY